VEAYIAEIANIPKDKHVFIDEMGIDTFLHREYAYAKKGVKVTGYISGKKHRRTGLVTAKRNKQIIAPLQYDGSMDSALFECWFENRLIPELPSSSTITMDNASFHRKSRLIPIAEKYGHRIIFLPPYSPEMNPVEKFWAWLRGRMKKVLPFWDDFDAALCYCFNGI
jgi:transposase